VRVFCEHGYEPPGFIKGDKFVDHLINSQLISEDCIIDLVSFHADLGDHAVQSALFRAFPQYVFMAWCLVKYRDNFTFSFTILNLDARWRLVVSFTPRPLYPRERAPISI